jgi:hypothetical protein
MDIAECGELPPCGPGHDLWVRVPARLSSGAMPAPQPCEGYSRPSGCPPRLLRDTSSGTITGGAGLPGLLLRRRAALPCRPQPRGPGFFPSAALRLL